MEYRRNITAKLRRHFLMVMLLQSDRWTLVLECRGEPPGCWAPQCTSPAVYSQDVFTLLDGNILKNPCPLSRPTVNVGSQMTSLHTIPLKYNQLHNAAYLLCKLWYFQIIAKFQSRMKHERLELISIELTHHQSICWPAPLKVNILPWRKQLRNPWLLN